MQAHLATVFHYQSALQALKTAGITTADLTAFTDVFDLPTGPGALTAAQIETMQTQALDGIKAPLAAFGRAVFEMSAREGDLHHRHPEVPWNAIKALAYTADDLSPEEIALLLPELAVFDATIPDLNAEARAIIAQDEALLPVTKDVLQPLVSEYLALQELLNWIVVRAEGEYLVDPASMGGPATLEGDLKKVEAYIDRIKILIAKLPPNFVDMKYSLDGLSSFVSGVASSAKPPTRGILESGLEPVVRMLGEHISNANRIPSDTSLGIRPDVPKVATAYPELKKQGQAVRATIVKDQLIELLR